MKIIARPRNPLKKKKISPEILGALEKIGAKKNAARSENGSTVKSTIYAWTCAWRRPLPHASC